MTKMEIRKLAKDCILSAVAGAGYKVWDDDGTEYGLTDEEREYFTLVIDKYENSIYRLLNNKY